jgi:hypothetical protein
MRTFASLIGPALVAAGSDTHVHNKRGTSFFNENQVANIPKMVCGDC